MEKRLHIRSLALTHVGERERGILGLGPGQRLGLDLGQGLGLISMIHGVNFQFSLLKNED